MRSDADRLQALEDREAIKEAVAKYSLYILTQETSKIAELFSEDGVFRIASANIHVAGRDALMAFYQRMTPGVAFPFVQTSTIEIEADRASHVGVMNNSAHVQGQTGYLGIYQDKLRRAEGRWLFTDRSFIFLQGEPTRPRPD